ncbi:MAG: archaellin/type IV pilin N-terminal domain-containing protein [Promethearchaeota archaeon]|jgi:flagellin-like protein
MDKRGVSPVIATVLLIAMVVVIGLIIFLWFRGMTQEAVTKFGGTNIELICNDVDFDATYSRNMLSISNIGNVPIFGMKLKIFKEGSHTTEDLRDLGSWSELGLNQGGVFSGNIGNEVSGGDKIILIPVLIGESEKGERAHTCNEGQHGYEIII